MVQSDRPADWQGFFDSAARRVRQGTSLELRGSLTRLSGLVLEAAGIRVPVGSQCLIRSGELPAVLAEVVGFSNDRAFLMPAGDVQGLASGAAVMPLAPEVRSPRLHGGPVQGHAGYGMLRLPLGNGLLGRVVDAQGNALDRMGPVVDVVRSPMNRQPINAMDRAPVREPLDTGVRAINAL